MEDPSRLRRSTSSQVGDAKYEGLAILMLAEAGDVDALEREEGRGDVSGKLSRGSKKHDVSH